MKKLTLVLILFLIASLLPAYVASVMWRAHVAEIKLFGVSDLTPNAYKYKFVDPPVADSYGQPTFIFFRDQQPVTVWRQKVNGFQHMYGSALSGYELGNVPASWLFCANEYVEAAADFVTDKQGIDKADLRDRHKDLFHNQTGRKIGLEARRRHLNGKAADDFMQEQVLEHMEQGYGYISHYSSPLVDKLKSEAQLGCPGLPPPMALRKMLHY